MERKRKKKKQVRAGRWIADRQTLVLGVGVALFAVLLAGNFIYNDSGDRARILRVSGNVSIDRAGCAVLPVAGTVLNEQDKVITGEGAYLELAYDESHKDVLRIGADSKVVLESAAIEKSTNIFMDKGEVILKLEKLDKGSTFKVRTPTAVCGVRGTSFGISLRGKEAVVTDYESKIFVKGLNPDYTEMEGELLLNDGWKVNVSQFEKPSRVSAVTEEERASWVAWINEVDALPRDPSFSNNSLSKLSFVKNILENKHLSPIAALMNSATSSISLLAFMLYLALAINIGRAFL